MKEVSKQLNEFKKFILRGNVVELAVAVAIGAAFTGVVTAMTDGIIKPLIASFGSAEIGQGLGFSIRGGSLAQATFLDFGKLISTTLNFVIVAAVVFFLVIQPRMDGRDPKLRNAPRTTSETLVPFEEEGVS